MTSENHTMLHNNISAIYKKKKKKKKKIEPNCTITSVLVLIL